MNGNTIGVISVLFGLFAFGVLFNQAINWARRSGWMEPYTAFWVAAGVLVTIAGIALVDTLIDWNAGITSLICFAASGTPMILGDAARYVAATRHEIEEHRHDES